ncbi:hypothetical protein SFRURICE_011379 [Spodoptera frugiperda]|nr:hypothetical protein SFRURICE_011379 [Spodoptera frugiperda]
MCYETVRILVPKPCSQGMEQPPQMGPIHRKTRVEAVVLHAAAVFGACDVNMADNETEENTEKFSYVVGETAMDIICGILFILSLIAFFYGVTSWCLIKKFRHFRNYVMLSAITVNTLRLSCYLIFRLAFTHFPLPVEVYIFIFADFVYFSLSFHCWLLVFLVIYVTVVYYLFNEGDSGSWTSSKKWGRFYISTLIFILSNLIVLAAIIDILSVRILIVDVIGEIGEYLNTIVISIYIMINALERIYEGEIIFAYYKRGNAASLLGTFPSDSDADEYFDA